MSEKQGVYEVHRKNSELLEHQLPGIDEDLDLSFERLPFEYRTNEEREAFLKVRYQGIRSLSEQELDLFDRMIKRMAVPVYRLYPNEISELQAKVRR
ncbi:MAG: hypothetical protein IBX50_09645 [Marinospirillum sp.]|uniref:hypothetical protein n=1 Tax=Marinospirillum sp. TaxID=2183934 RepID=UPI0019E7A3D8|nr:hypothetical protein [Marinospirillum sp.]MBE0506965.1 hypothetical protein [Marinospirillum sp.]